MSTKLEMSGFVKEVWEISTPQTSHYFGYSVEFESMFLLWELLTSSD